MCAHAELARKRKPRRTASQNVSTTNRLPLHFTQGGIIYVMICDHFQEMSTKFVSKQFNVRWSMQMIFVYVVHQM